MDDFTGDSDFAYEIDKLFEENDDIFGANDLLFNKETTGKVQQQSKKIQGLFAFVSPLNKLYVIKHLHQVMTLSHLPFPEHTIYIL